jgi:hypothetical protein
MKISEFSSRRPAAKFTEIGDRVEGRIVEQPQLERDKFGNANDKVLVIRLDDATLFARKQMADAIGEAVSESGVDEIEADGWLAVEYVDDKSTTSGSFPMKVYAAEYEPPAELGRGQLGFSESA